MDHHIIATDTLPTCAPLDPEEVLHILLRCTQIWAEQLAGGVGLFLISEALAFTSGSSNGILHGIVLGARRLFGR